MRVIFPILMAISFAPPLYFGHIRAQFWTAILWSAVMSIETVYGGWRAPKGGTAGSLVIGTSFAALWCIPTYWLGRMI
jgi:hypothetical protein